MCAGCRRYPFDRRTVRDSVVVNWMNRNVAGLVVGGQQETAGFIGGEEGRVGRKHKRSLKRQGSIRRIDPEARYFTVAATGRVEIAARRVNGKGRWAAGN